MQTHLDFVPIVRVKEFVISALEYVLTKWRIEVLTGII